MEMGDESEDVALRIGERIEPSPPLVGHEDDLGRPLDRDAADLAKKIPFLANRPQKRLVISQVLEKDLEGLRGK